MLISTSNISDSVINQRKLIHPDAFNLKAASCFTSS